MTPCLWPGCTESAVTEVELGRRDRPDELRHVGNGAIPLCAEHSALVP